MSNPQGHTRGFTTNYKNVSDRKSKVINNFYYPSTHKTKNKEKDPVERARILLHIYMGLENHPAPLEKESLVGLKAKLNKKYQAKTIQHKTTRHKTTRRPQTVFLSKI